MNTVQLGKDLAQATGLPAARAENIVKYLFARMGQALAAGDTIKCHQFGHFSVKARAARQGHNPQTGEAIQIAAQNVAHWSVSVSVKDVINKRKKPEDLLTGIDPRVNPRQPATTAPAAKATGKGGKSGKGGKGKKADTPAAPAAPAAPAPAAPAASEVQTPPPPPQTEAVK